MPTMPEASELAEAAWPMTGPAAAGTDTSCQPGCGPKKPESEGRYEPGQKSQWGRLGSQSCSGFQ